MVDILLFNLQIFKNLVKISYVDLGITSGEIMKRFKSGLIALCLMPMVLNADIGIDGMYINGTAGVGVASDKGDINYKTGFDLAGVIGNKSSNVRYEVELLWQRHEASTPEDGKTHTGVFSGMANVHYDFEDVDVFSMLPAVGIGLGFARVGSSGNNHDNVFSYQAMVSFHYPFTNDWSGFIGYRYFRTAKVKHLGDRNWQSNILNVGLTYHLG